MSVFGNLCLGMCMLFLLALPVAGQLPDQADPAGELLRFSSFDAQVVGSDVAPQFHSAAQSVKMGSGNRLYVIREERERREAEGAIVRDRKIRRVMVAALESLDPGSIEIWESPDRAVWNVAIYTYSDEDRAVSQEFSVLEGGVDDPYLRHLKFPYMTFLFSTEAEAVSWSAELRGRVASVSRRNAD